MKINGTTGHIFIGCVLIEMTNKAIFHTSCIANAFKGM